MKKVMIFGVFDGFHPGHEYFIKQAKEEGECLIIVVARDEVVKRLKGRYPEKSENERQAVLSATFPKAVVVLGDKEEGVYRVIHEEKPTLICLGHDQDALQKDLELKMQNGDLPKILLKKIAPFEAHLYQSSLLRKDSF